MLELLAMIIIGMLLLAGLYPFLLAVAVLLPLGLTVVGLFAAVSGNWSVAVGCAVVVAVFFGLIDSKWLKNTDNSQDKFSRFECDGINY